MSARGEKRQGSMAAWKRKRMFSRGAMFVLCLVFAVLFLLPTVLTFTNSFMSEA